MRRSLAKKDLVAIETFKCDFMEVEEKNFHNLNACVHNKNIKMREILIKIKSKCDQWVKKATSEWFIAWKIYVIKNINSIIFLPKKVSLSGKWVFFWGEEEFHVCERHNVDNHISRYLKKFIFGH
jgi:hypothetical protein